MSHAASPAQSAAETVRVPLHAGDDARPVVEAARLTRAFGRRVAVRDVSFTIHGGECLALFGPNGAGKTTLLRVLAGLLRPTSGTAHIDGVSLPGGAAARAVVGLISHHSMLYAALTARENVEFAARMYGVSAPADAALRALEKLRIAERADSAVRALSRGMQQRVSLARAIVHDPRVVLLDEPYTGLDEGGAAALTEALQSLKAAGAALLLVTHSLGEGLALGSHTAIMRDGRVVQHSVRGMVDVETYRDQYRQAVRS